MISILISCRNWNGSLLADLPQHLLAQFSDHSDKEEEKYREMAQVVDPVNTNNVANAQNVEIRAQNNDGPSEVILGGDTTETDSE